MSGKRQRREAMARDRAIVQTYPLDDWTRPPVDPRAVEAEAPLESSTGKPSVKR